MSKTMGIKKTKNGAIFSPELFRFFRELGRNNHKPWMDANRERYRTVLVEPFRALLERTSEAARKLNPRFLTAGRVGENFSRINRDIRFAKDKSPYRSQMYLFYAEPGKDGAQIYVGISAEAVTSGFRIYGDTRNSVLAHVARPRAQANPGWIELQQRRLGKKYDSYWYSTQKGEWVKHPGWPAKPEDWKKLQGWVVRKKLAPAVATRSAFAGEVSKIFREVYPLYEFTRSPDWKP